MSLYGKDLCKNNDDRTNEVNTGSYTQIYNYRIPVTTTTK